jgi:hypothetical protein
MEKWVELLDVKNDTTHLALVATFGLFLFGNHFRWFSVESYSWVIPLAWFGFILFGCLFAAKVLAAFLAIASTEAKTDVG